MNNITELLTQAINEWDPIGLCPITPEDEYCEEIKEIENFLLQNNNIDVNLLSLKIFDIFVTSFNVDIFKYNREECKPIASKIIRLLNFKDFTKENGN